jgi:cysteine desulfurase/selenocysteine lyase
MLDVTQIKADFPIFTHHRELVYLDSAATSHKPQVVLDALNDFYSLDNANVHRGVYELSERASQAFEDAREKVANFISAKSSLEIVFTKGTTESLNLIAYSYALSKLKVGDEVLVADFEHHSNFLPWLRVCQETGATLRILVSEESGQISQSEWQSKLSNKTKIVAIAHASNVLGTIQDIKKIAAMVHQFGAVLVVDGAQAIPHLAVNVNNLDFDFYVFSGHKMLAPMGIGVLYAKQSLLEEMSPYQLGGGMIESVKIDEVIYADSPSKFEAGTPDVAGAVALASAIDYLNSIGLSQIRDHEIMLSEYLLEKLSKIKRVKLFGNAPADQRTGLVSFSVEGIHAHDLSDFLAKQQVALRAGFHCAMPLHQNRSCGATLRASYYLYNQISDLDALLENLEKAIAYYG